MPLYMSQYSYASEAWARLLDQPQNRAEAIRQLLAHQDGQLLYFYHCLGDYDGLSIFDLPDEVTAAAFVGAAIIAGHLKDAKTTALARAPGFLSPSETEPRPARGYYLLQAAYTSEAWAAMVHHPQNRLAAVQPVAHNLGGSLVDAWLSFSEYDVVTLLHMPDTLSAAAYIRALAAGGALRTLKITPLLTIDESMEVMRRAGAAGYQPPQ